MGDSIALAKERDRLKPDQMVLFEQSNVGLQVADFQYDHPALFGFSLSLPFASLAVVHNGPQEGRGVLMVVRDSAGIGPYAVEEAEQVSRFVAGHLGADGKIAGIQD